MKNPSKKWLLAIAIICLAGGGYMYWNMTKSNASDVTYKTGTVKKGTLTVSVSGTGNVAVTNSVNVSPSISGTVYDLSVAYGDTVKKGDTLFKIKNDQLDISVSQAYASYIQAKQTVSKDELSLSQAQTDKTTIYADANATDTMKDNADMKVAEAQTALEVAKINQKAAKASYDLAKTNAGYRTVTADISGTITSLNVKNGDQWGNSSSGSSTTGSTNSSTSSSSSSSSSSAAAVIADLSTMKASISINEADSTAVSVGQKVNMTFDAIDNLTLTGTVESINALGSESSGVVTYPAVVTFDSLDNRVKPQMSVTAEISTTVKQDVLMAANSAVETSTDGSYYVLKMKDSKPVKTTVEIGVANDTYTEITSGLTQNDTIVIQTITASDKSSSTSSSSKSNSGASLRNLTGSTGGMGGGFSGPPGN